MKKYYSLFFLLIFATLNLNGQNITKLIQTADSLLGIEDFSGSLKIRNQVLLQLGKKNVEQSLQQRYKQQVTEANLAESPSIAVKKVKIALSYFNRLKLKPINEQMDLYNLLYHSLAYNDQDEEALQAALLSYQKLDNNTKVENPDVIDLVYDIGFLYSRLGNYFEAINYYKKSLALYVRRNGEINDDVALNYNNLAYAYGHAYNQKYTINYYKKAASIWEKVYAKTNDTNDYLMTVYQSLNATLIGYGALDEAKIFLAKLNKHFKNKYGVKEGKKQTKYFAARQLFVLANVRTLSAMGDFNKALLYCDSLKAETKFTKETKKDIEFVVNSYALISDFAYDQTYYEQTITICKPILSIANQFDLRHQKMIINAKIASAYEKLNFLDEGLKHIELADQNTVKDQFNSSKFSIQLIKAQLLSKKGEYQKALNLTKNTIQQILHEKTGEKVNLSNAKFKMVQELGSESFINIFTVSGHLYLDFYRDTKNKVLLKDATNLFNIAAQLFNEYYLKGEYNESLNYYQQRITEGLLKSLILSSANFKEKLRVINLIEQNASQHLIKAYDKKIKRSNAKNVAYIDQINALKLELAYYKKLEIADKRKAKSYMTKVSVLSKEIALLTHKIAETEKNYQRFNDFEDFNLNEILKAINSDEQILKYYVTEQAIFTVLIGHNSLEINEVNFNAKNKKQVELFIEQSKVANSEVNVSASHLYQTLLPKKIKHKVVIIPDNFLNYLPFESLFDEQTKKYFVQKHIVSYDYSLQMWLLRHQPNKTFGKANLAAFSPSYEGSVNTNRDETFKNLKFAGQEAAAISKLFNGDLFSSQQATKQTFINQMGKYNVFHLSMHSQLYEDDFNKSFLLFANDEKLYFSELYGMSIPAHLVVLSACNTGNGLLRKGEGIMSMSRALTYAGVQSAIVSLWQVPDKETSEIMVLFYQNLKKGQDKAEALANAKTKFIVDNPMKNHPFYWAGFIVNGDVSPIYSFFSWWIMGFALLTLLVVLVIVFRKRLFQIGK